MLSQAFLYSSVETVLSFCIRVHFCHCHLQSISCKQLHSLSRHCSFLSFSILHATTRITSTLLHMKCDQVDACPNSSGLRVGPCPSQSGLSIRLWPSQVPFIHGASASAILKSHAVFSSQNAHLLFSSHDSYLLICQELTLSPLRCLPGFPRFASHSLLLPHFVFMLLLEYAYCTRI